MADRLKAALPVQQEAPLQADAGREQAIAAAALVVSDVSAKLADVTELRQQLAAASAATAAIGVAPATNDAQRALELCLPQRGFDLVASLAASWQRLTAASPSSSNSLGHSGTAAAVCARAVQCTLAATPSIGATSSLDGAGAVATPVLTPPANGCARVPLLLICTGGNLGEPHTPGSLSGGATHRRRTWAQTRASPPRPLSPLQHQPSAPRCLPQGQLRPRLLPHLVLRPGAQVRALLSLRQAPRRAGLVLQQREGRGCVCPCLGPGLAAMCGDRLTGCLV